jgi:hypothetical protein
MANLFLMSEFGEQYGIVMCYLHDKITSYLPKHCCDRVQKSLWAATKVQF